MHSDVGRVKTRRRALRHVADEIAPRGQPKAARADAPILLEDEREAAARGHTRLLPFGRLALVLQDVTPGVEALSEPDE